jgi:hypothetical protein
LDEQDYDVWVAAEYPNRPSSPRGAPSKHFWPELYLLAGLWLENEGGEDEHGSQAKLERYLHALVAERGESASDSTVRLKASDILKIYRRTKGR